MRTIALLLLCSLVAGCMVNRRQGMAYNDEYDGIQVEQTMGNSVSAMPLQKTIVCLNPRRETRRAHSFTNPVVTSITNISLVHVTNLTITATTNMSLTLSTNLLAPPLAPPAPATNEVAEAGAETNTLVNIPPPATPPNSTNNTVTKSANVTLSRGPSQTAMTANHQQLLNRQITVNTTNMSLTTADNEIITIETNIVVNTYTNISISVVTNQQVVYTNQFLRDYYVYTELTPPLDFTLQNSGESLVLVVDGVRHGLVATPSQTAFVSRKGYQTTLYRATPELIADIANAKEVKLRIRGVNSVIERKMNEDSRSNFRRFMLKYFAPGSGEEDAPAQPGVREANLNVTPASRRATVNFQNQYENN